VSEIFLPNIIKIR